MILAAGRGTRLAPLTDHCPKPLVEVGGRALIDRHLEALAKAGVRRVVINLNWLAQMIMTHIGDGQQFGLAVTYSLEHGDALETAGGIVKALPMFGDQPFWLVNADIFTDFRFSWTEVRADAARVLMVANPPHNPKGDFCVQAGLLAPAISAEAPTWTYSGVGLYDPQLFRELAPGKRPLAPLLSRGASEMTIRADIYDGVWDDIGTPERLHARQRILEAAAD